MNKLVKNASIQAAMLQSMIGGALSGVKGPADEKVFRGNNMLKLENFFDKDIQKVAFDQTKEIRRAVEQAHVMIRDHYGTSGPPIQIVWRWKDAWTIPICNKGTEYPIAYIAAVTYSEDLSITALKTAERMELAPTPHTKTGKEIFEEFIGYVEMVEEKKRKRRAR